MNQSALALLARALLLQGLAFKGQILLESVMEDYSSSFWVSSCRRGSEVFGNLSTTEAQLSSVF